MEKQQVNRRRFLQDGAVAAAGVAGGLGAVANESAVAEETAPEAAVEQQPDGSQILSYNENMTYRLQGSTGWWVSDVCLGGHYRGTPENRREIVSRCLDAGINYIDACTKGEVMRDAAALKGRREKMYLALSHCGREARNEEYRTAKKLLESLDEVLRDSEQEYTDLWRITCFEPGGRHTFDTACEIVEALETAKKQGKARAVGFSSHDRRWIKFMVEYFPQIDAVCFPFTTMSKRAQTDSLFPALKKCNVGAFGIKPFAAGSLFTGDPDEDCKRARLALRYILHSDTVVPIPGMCTVDQVDNVVKAVVERRQLDTKEVGQLNRASEQMMAKLPANYQWLKQWQYV